MPHSRQQSCRLWTDNATVVDHTATILPQSCGSYRSAKTTGSKPAVHRSLPRGERGTTSHAPTVDENLCCSAADSVPCASRPGPPRARGTWQPAGSSRRVRLAATHGTSISWHVPILGLREMSSICSPRCPAKDTWVRNHKKICGEFTSSQRE